MKCRICKEEMVSEDFGDYCSDCACDDCGTPLETENERGANLCDECNEDA